MPLLARQRAMTALPPAVLVALVGGGQTARAGEGQRDVAAFAQQIDKQIQQRLDAECPGSTNPLGSRRGGFDMRRVLDELADALDAVQGRPRPRLVRASVELRHQFGLPITPSCWAELGHLLRCPLPPLGRRPDGVWSFPCGWTTVWDVAAYLAERCPDWEPPRGETSAVWREAQVFVRVRASLVEALNVSPEKVVRSARLIKDLGAE
jgi:hypothetical protein